MNKIRFFDGGMGTMLQAAGLLGPGELPEPLNLTHPEEIAAILQEEKRNRYGEGTPPPENYLCLNPEGEPIASNYLNQSFKQFLRDHGLREIRLHDLRHTCASLLIQKRTPLIEVQQWLGHSTLSTTADLYAHLEYETKLASAQTLKKI